MNKPIRMLVLIFVLWFVFVCGDVAHASSGAWLPDGGTSGGSSGGSGGGGGQCSGDGAFYLLQCTGVSWVYYEYISDYKSKSEGWGVNFVPIIDSTVSTTTIDGTCAHPGRGFWHFGRNAKAFSYGGYGDTTYLIGYSPNGSVYRSSPTKAGHASTYTMGYYRSLKKEWGSNLNYSTAWTNDALDHVIYRKINNEYVPMYKAKYYASDPDIHDDSPVLQAFRRAYRIKNGKEYNGSKIQDGVYAFCSWDENDAETKYTLTASGKIDGDTNTVVWPTINKSNPVTSGSKASVNVSLIQKKDGNLYKFAYWGSSCQKGDDVKRTCTVDKLTENKTVYAYYKKLLGLPCSSTPNRTGGTLCDSDIGINQRKSNNDSWTKDPVYVKPGDMVYLRGWFNPQYQEEFATVPENLNFQTTDDPGGNGWIDNGFDRLSLYQSLFWYGFNSWKNEFSIVRPDGSAETIEGKEGRNGEYSGESSYTANGPGAELVAKSLTNYTNNTSTTPRDIEFWYSEGDYEFSAQIDVRSKESDPVVAYVPYNFEVSTNILGTYDDVVYAGETKEITYETIVGKRENGIVGDTYATKVPNAKWGLRFAYCSYDDDCRSVFERGGGKEIVGAKGDLNENNNLEGSTSTKSTTMNIPDYSAGSRICVVSFVSPKNSNKDISMFESDFSTEQSQSDMKCFTIAKKPTFQVWGSGLYSAGSFTTSVSVKNSLQNLQSGNDETLNNKMAFGSWAELGLIANGAVKGFSSGAATSYVGYDPKNGDMNQGLYGSIGEELLGINNNYATNFCLRSPLSFANIDCDKNIVGELNMNSISSNTGSNKSSLISRFEEITEDVDTDSKNTDEMKTHFGLKGKSKIIIADNKIVDADGKDFVIKSNIEYNNYYPDANGIKGYSKLEEIPKLIIYAENIYISCDVGRVDAVLIANNAIDTCTDENGQAIGDANDKRRSKQLIINGAIMANTIKFNRTYGAAFGAYSIIPAEIINYDSSLYLWSNRQAETKNTGKLTETYTRELAPRY